MDSVSCQSDVPCVLLADFCLGEVRLLSIGCPLSTTGGFLSTAVGVRLLSIRCPLCTTGGYLSTIRGVRLLSIRCPCVLLVDLSTVGGVRLLSIRCPLCTTGGFLYNVGSQTPVNQMSLEY